MSEYLLKHLSTLAALYPQRSEGVSEVISTHSGKTGALEKWFELLFVEVVVADRGAGERGGNEISEPRLHLPGGLPQWTRLDQLLPIPSLVCF
jgi:hypothetical protein